jgi:hypothetical protein
MAAQLSPLLREASPRVVLCAPAMKDMVAERPRRSGVAGVIDALSQFPKLETVESCEGNRREPVWVCFTTCANFGDLINRGKKPDQDSRDEPHRKRRTHYASPPRCAGISACNGEQAHCSAPTR